MNITIITSLLYIITSLICLYSINNDLEKNKKIIFFFIIISLFFHSLNIDINSLALASTISTTSWAISFLIIILSFKKRFISLSVVVIPISTILYVISVIYPDATVKNTYSLKNISHIFLSFFAYTLLFLACCQSILLKLQNKKLHKKKINAFINNLPSLEEMEKLLFKILFLGFILLTASIFSGFFVVDNIFEQKVAHKTIFSIISWLIFLILIIGHKNIGWRGNKSFITIQIAFSFLVLSYFGSKIVLEKILI